VVEVVAVETVVPTKELAAQVAEVMVAILPHQQMELQTLAVVAVVAEAPSLNLCFLEQQVVLELLSFATKSHQVRRSIWDIMQKLLTV
jgi:hypothetical protein